MKLILGRLDLPPGENLDQRVKVGRPGQLQDLVIGPDGVNGQTRAGERVKARQSQEKERQRKKKREA